MTNGLRIDDDTSTNYHLWTHYSKSQSIEQFEAVTNKCMHGISPIYR